MNSDHTRKKKQKAMKRKRNRSNFLAVHMSNEQNQIRIILSVLESDCSNKQCNTELRPNAITPVFYTEHFYTETAHLEQHQW